MWLENVFKFVARVSHTINCCENCLRKLEIDYFQDHRIQMTRYDSAAAGAVVGLRPTPTRGKSAKDCLGTASATGVA